MSEWNVRSILHALVRSWWLLAGVALIAGVIAYAAAGRGETAWVGDATLQIDNAIVSRIPALPIPERLLVELQSTEFKERVFSEAGVTDGQLSFYTTGNPQTELHVQYVGSSEELTRRVTDVAATSVVDRYIEMSEPGLARMRLAVAAANER